MKNLINLIRRWVKGLIFRFFHRQGWAEERAKKILGDGNNFIPEVNLLAFGRFVSEIRKIERSRISDSQRMDRTDWEEEKLRRYGPAYRFSCLATRINNERAMKEFMATNGQQRPDFSIFSIQAHT